LDYGHALLSGLPQDALLLAYADHETFPIIYLQTVRGERPDVTVRVLGGPPDRDVYWHPAVQIETELQQRNRPIFTTMPYPPIEASECVPEGLAYRYVPQRAHTEARTPLWKPVTLRYRSDTTLGYFERGALASVDLHHAAYFFAVGETDSAHIVVRRAASTAEDNAGSLNNLATLLANVGDLDGAEWLWRRALTVDSSLVPARRNLDQLMILRREQQH